MNENKSKNIPQVILAPLTGKAVPLSEVPDSVFSEKVLGDGVAIIPADGKIVSPVDGEISTVAETSHAYGFTSEDGQEVLILTEKNVKAEEIDGWREADGRSKAAKNEKRLDYIFCNTQEEVRASNVICNGKNAPVVSDHYGVMIMV